MPLVTGVVVDSTGKKDSRDWRVWSPTYAQSATGEVVSTRVRTINVTAGLFRAVIDPGVVVLENPDGKRWTVTVPETDIDLWDLIALAAGLPPETPQGAIQNVVWEYLETHPIEAGPEGDSAYEVAVANGFVGTEAEWLASLVGPQGEQGEQGIQGEQGVQGPPGADGTGSGDMTKAVYDPNNVSGNAFSQDNMVDGTANKNYTATEKSKLSGIANNATANDTDANLKNRANHTGTQPASTISDFNTAADARISAAALQATSQKNQPNGYAGLDSSALIPASLLPSYVDDVLEYANAGSLPGTGATGKIYVALDTGKIYRWSGSAYVEISPSPGSTDAVPEGSTNLYYTNARADGRIASAVGVSVQGYNANTTQLGNATTGTGSIVRATSPTLVTPALGTPASGNLANCTFPTLNQSTTGNAATATQLATARNINGVAFNGTADITVADSTKQPRVETVNTVGTSGSAQTIPDPATGATMSHITLTANCTLTFPTAAAGKSFTLALAQDATGSRTVTWPTIKWPGGTTPTLTTTASKVDRFTFVCDDGTNWIGFTAGLNF
ncbi:collagen-like triple helix repeat-containing protein [Mycolicibacterium canariasense]|uniref:collagen-like triple helix repeat-containing protein n=1 Tax=Mycolicibacterium canariasense TaxID=228230 RepID=UPI0032D587C2